MRKLAIYFMPLLALAVTACGDDSSNNPNDDLSAKAGDMAKAPGADLAMNEVDAGNGFPAAPTLGAQIDRLGRAGVNTALTDPFWDDGTQTAAAHHAKQDAYNAASDPAAWSALTLSAATTTVQDIVKGALAVYDALDGTSLGLMTGDGCGNQLAYGFNSTTPYTELATVLVDDQIYVNSASGSCTTYLAVEANVLGVTNTDCGGRTPNYNTIDITYSALASAAIVTTAGCLTGAAHCGVSNGIYSDPDTANAASAATFPFLGAAN